MEVPTNTQKPRQPSATGLSKVGLEIAGMRCASCVAHVTKAIESVPGVSTAAVNLATGQAAVLFDASVVTIQRIAESVMQAGYQVVAQDASGTQPARGSQTKTLLARKRLEERHWRNRAVIGLLLSAPLMLFMLAPPLHAPAWVALALATAVQIYTGKPFHTGALRSLRLRRANMDALISGGSTLAYVYSLVALLRSWALRVPTPHLYFETGAFILTFVSVGKWLETFATQRTLCAVEQLLRLFPDMARVERGGRDWEIPASEVQIGDTVMLRPGERVPVDGVVSAGDSAIDESLLTGESMPVVKGPGDKVVAGTINLSGSLKFTAMQVGDDTVLSQIVKIVESAQTHRAEVEKLTDRVSARFVPIVLGVSLVAFAAWCLRDLVLGAPVDWAHALLVAVAVLIVACPCALGLATPTAILVGAGVGARRGILFKDGRVFELAGSLTTAVLDKTGTVTEGRLGVTDILASSQATPAEVLRLAASIESESEHPIGRAIVRRAREENTEVSAPVGFRSIPGIGVEGTVDGVHVLAARIEEVQARGTEADSHMIDRARSLQQEGKTVLALAVGGRRFGIIAVADTLKPTSIQAVRELKDLGLEVVLITGDSAPAAQGVAQRVGITRVIAGVLPADKARKVEELRRGGHRVVMVGDGINDAPALVQADVGIAVGTGTDVAIESADIVLMHSDLRGVSEAIRLSRATWRKIRQNLVWALVYNCLLIPMAAIGWVHPILAAAAMSLSSVSVVGNSLSLGRWSSESGAAKLRECAASSRPTLM